MRLPNLRRWLEDLEAGKRRPTTSDATWRAACFEREALDAARDGRPVAAREALRSARAAAVSEEGEKT